VATLTGAMYLPVKFIASGEKEHFSSGFQEAVWKPLVIVKELGNSRAKDTKRARKAFFFVSFAHFCGHFRIFKQLLKESPYAASIVFSRRMTAAS
jgi:hypothetical protein